jgi:hypothetical protein
MLLKGGSFKINNNKNVGFSTIFFQKQGPSFIGPTKRLVPTNRLRGVKMK